jgi:putative transposase
VAALRRPLPARCARSPTAQARRRLHHRAALDLRRRKLADARADLAAWLERWQGTYAELCDWVEENIEETLTVYRLPVGLRSTNLIERLNGEIRRRTYVLPNADACLPRARLAAEQHEEWREGHRYMNVQLPKKEQLRAAA